MKMEHMDHISLYRKWRPQTFQELVGQPHVTNTLANALNSQRTVHAYLFCGPRGTGKTSTARILAKAINCEEGPTSVPCNVCDACVSISQGSALDVIEIDAASNRKIDEIRDLLEKIPYTPTSLRSKVYIVDEVHQLTPEASSALLKTLEEPPGHVVFVLATTEPHKILPTIVSRCQRFDFALVPTQEIASLLSRIATHEGIEIEPDAVGMIAEHAHGSVRDAIGVMDQISNLTGETVVLGQVAELLGEVESDLVLEIVELISDRDTAGALALVGRMVDSGKEPRRFVESLIAHLRSLFLIQNAAKPREIVDATDDHYSRLDLQSKRLKRYEVVRLIERLGETHRQMRWSENERMVLECALVKATSLDTDMSLEGILFRLEELERKLEGVTAANGGDGPAAPRLAGDSGATGGRGPARSRRADDSGTTGGARKTTGAVAPPAQDEARAGQKSGAATGAQARAAASDGEGELPAAAGGDSLNAAEGQAGQGPAAPSGTPQDREKARGAWKAVLGELKSQGQMRLYALLTKAKIVDASDREVVLGFPEDSSFQLEILNEAGQMAKVEKAWEHFFGAPVKLTLAMVQGGSTGNRGSRRSDPPEFVAPGRDAAPGAVPQPVEAAENEEPQVPAESERRKSDARKVAERLKDTFDGEIIE